ncbi:hypothetical protein B0H13DRAFT_2673638 [Mycena leptocephala]|nr:hypothetical protein B0H13DRAFT_2673638 [Mycena leptocephala]
MHVRAGVCGTGVVREKDERIREGDARSDEDADGEGEAEARTHFCDVGAAPVGGIVVGWEWDNVNPIHREGEVAGLKGLPIPPTPTQRHLIV